MFANIDLLVDWFKEEGLPFFVVATRDGIIGKNILLKDIDEAADKLTNMLTRYSEDMTGAKYSVYLFSTPPKGNVKLKECDGLGAIIFKKPVSNREEGEYLPYREYKAVQELKQELSELKEAIVLQNIADNSETDEEVENNMQPANMLGAVLNHPNFAPVMAGLFTRLFDTILPPINKVPTLAGINDKLQIPMEEQAKKIAEAIDILAAHDDQIGDDLMKLATIAKDKPDQFKFLINMLRSQ